MRAAGWLAIAAGLVGFCFITTTGLSASPAAISRFLNSADVWRAPSGAPGADGDGRICLDHQPRGLQARPDLAGVPLRTALLVTIVVCLFGAILQAGLLHFRGAFNNPLMYAPLTIPVLTALAGIWMMAEPCPARSRHARSGFFG